MRRLVSAIIKVVSAVRRLLSIISRPPLRSPRFVGMVRFGRIKKKTKAEPVQDDSSAKSSSQEPYQEHDADTDITIPLPLPTGSDPSSPRTAPRISLPHVDTLLNMHQVNGLFDTPKSREEQNGSTVIESTG